MIGPRTPLASVALRVSMMRQGSSGLYTSEGTDDGGALQVGYLNDQIRVRQLPLVPLACVS